MNIISKAHGECHWKFDKMLDSIKSCFCWQNLRNDIETFIRSCERCQSEELKRKHRAPGTYIEQPSQVNELWQ